MQDWSIRMVDSILKIDTNYREKWCYEFGLILKAVEMISLKINDAKYYHYIKSNMDRFVKEDGKIETYNMYEYNIDNINQGKVLFGLYNKTKEQKYKDAIYTLREQMVKHPRTTTGNYWHKCKYPHQVWLDGLYMAMPFLTEFAKTFDEPNTFQDVANQFIVMAKKARDNKTGLYFHAWDESRGMKWSDDKTGCSPQFWARAIGWYCMALVDVLDHFPDEHYLYYELVLMLRELLEAVIKVQDKKSGCWYQVIDQGNREGNYLEASSSCMFVYSLAKALRKGYINDKYTNNLNKACDGILGLFVRENEDGSIALTNICCVAGLGGYPFRDGSYDYYIKEAVVENDYKGVAPFIYAFVELEELINNGIIGRRN